MSGEIFGYTFTFARSIIGTLRVNIPAEWGDVLAQVNDLKCVPYPLLVFLQH